MSCFNIYEDPSVPWWKRFLGYLVLVAVLFVVGTVTGSLKSEIGSAGALRQGYVYFRAGLVMLFVAAAVLSLCRKIKLGALPSTMIGFGAAVGSMQASCQALNGHYDSIAANGIEGIVIGAVCGAITFRKQKPLTDTTTSQGPSKPDGVA